MRPSNIDGIKNRQYMEEPTELEFESNDHQTRRKIRLKSFDKKFKQIIKKIHDDDADPLRELGPGITSYHQLLIMLFVLFFFLTILHVPISNIYSKYSFYKDDESYSFNQFSFGNLGFAKTECQI